MDQSQIDAFGAAIANAARSAAASNAPKISNSMTALHLRELFARYAAGNPFKAGQLVTPRAGYARGFVGEPYIVLQTFAPQPLEGCDTCAKQRAREDMQVCGVIEGNFVTTVDESWRWEIYAGPVEKLDG